MTTMQINTEIVNLLKLISGNKVLMKKVLQYIRELVGQNVTIEEESEYDKTKNFIDSFAGKWEDDNTADEMIADIYSARKSNNGDELLKILDA